MRTRVVMLAMLDATNIGIRTLTFARSRWSKVGGASNSLDGGGGGDKEEEESSRSDEAVVKIASVDMLDKGMQNAHTVRLGGVGGRRERKEMEDDV